MSWSGWALPWGSDGLLMPVGLYATDVLEMARQFVQLAGLGDEAMVPEAWMPFFQTRTRWSWLSRTGTRLASKHPSSAMRSTASWKSMPQQACGMPWILPGTKTRSNTSWWRSWMWASDNFSILEKKLAMDPLPISSRLRGSFTSSAIELLTWPSGSSKAPRDGFCRLDEI